LTSQWQTSNASSSCPRSARCLAANARSEGTQRRDSVSSVASAAQQQRQARTIKDRHRLVDLHRRQCAVLVDATGRGRGILVVRRVLRKDMARVSSAHAQPCHLAEDVPLWQAGGAADSRRARTAREGQVSAACGCQQRRSMREARTLLSLGSLQLCPRVGGALQSQSV
jgi:hypothetical protein